MKMGVLLLFVMGFCFQSQASAELEAVKIEAKRFYSLESTAKTFSYEVSKTPEAGCDYEENSTSVVICRVMDSAVGIETYYSIRHGISNLFMFKVERIEL